MALCEHGAGFDVGASCGMVLLPSETADAAEALQIADRRLYLDKGERRRESVTRQTGDVLLQALEEREPQLRGHVGVVGRLAEATAVDLGLGREEPERISLAARLHDIGKMAVPDAILAKPGPLEEAELGFIRQHTVVGERILRAAPALGHVAQLVRSSHERFDGTGYPDRLAGEEIPLGSRVVAVCDAFSAMTSVPPVQPGAAGRRGARGAAPLRGQPVRSRGGRGVLHRAGAARARAGARERSRAARSAAVA